MEKKNKQLCSICGATIPEGTGGCLDYDLVCDPCFEEAQDD